MLVQVRKMCVDIDNVKIEFKIILWLFKSRFNIVENLYQMWKLGLRKFFQSLEEKFKEKKLIRGVIDREMRLYSYICVLVELLKKRKIFKNIMEENFFELKKDLNLQIERVFFVQVN